MIDGDEEVTGRRISCFKPVSIRASWRWMKVAFHIDDGWWRLLRIDLEIVGVCIYLQQLIRSQSFG